ncbi:hypothetical protein CAOG_004426 [Capsaspora owczarzaki ATCC 30864]|uniref:Uncharacterized protein n=2 Tax=Capsaspora owczarzaki (strain ATCC 30864) TaxID=595528 RepID=A0A0D2VRW0_CAPO3|nr:hypothetical protein CAOG_004426 [Capsaspora owczarzaki ATCC 30864]
MGMALRQASAQPVHGARLGSGGSARSMTTSLKIAQTHVAEEIATHPEAPAPDPVRLTTRDSVQGRLIVEELGIVAGSSARSRNFLVDLWTRLRGFLGGELTSYSEMFTEATNEATEQAMKEAEALGATSIIRVRYQNACTETKITGVSVYVLCYGTAVRCVDRTSDAAHEYLRQLESVPMSFSKQQKEKAPEPGSASADAIAAAKPPATPVPTTIADVAAPTVAPSHIQQQLLSHPALLQQQIDLQHHQIQQLLALQQVQLTQLQSKLEAPTPEKEVILNVASSAKSTIVTAVQE